MPFPEPGVHLSLCTGLSIDACAKQGFLLRVYNIRCTLRIQSLRTATPHTWLSPAAAKLYASTVLLRHVRGSPARGLLLGLRPLFETSPGLAASRSSQLQHSTQSSRVRRMNPWCGRWSTLPLSARTSPQFGAREARAKRGSPSRSGSGGRALAAFSSRTRSLFVQRVPTSTSRAGTRIPALFTFAPAVARLGLASSRTVQAVRLLQAAIPTLAAFTAPFCTRPDSGEDDASDHRFLLRFHGTPPGQWCTRSTRWSCTGLAAV